MKIGDTDNGKFIYRIIFFVFCVLEFARAQSAEFENEIAESLAYPTVVSARSNDTFTFTVHNYDYEPLAQSNNILQNITTFGQAQTFSFANSANTVYILPLNSSFGSLSASIGNGCLFPISLITDQYPTYNVGSNTIVVDADYSATTIFGNVTVTPPIAINTTQVPDLRSTLFNWSIDLSTILLSDTTYYLSIYCPFYQSQTNPSLDFTLTAQEASSSITTNVDDGSKINSPGLFLLIPAQGSNTVVFSKLSSDTSFGFNSTNVSDISIALLSSNGGSTNVGSSFKVSKSSGATIVISNAASVSYTLLMTSSAKSSSSKLGIILGVILGVLGFLAIIAIVTLIVLRRLRKPSAYPERGDEEMMVNDTNRQERMKLHSEETPAYSGGFNTGSHGGQTQTAIVDVPLYNEPEDVPVPNGDTIRQVDSVQTVIAKF